MERQGSWQGTPLAQVGGKCGWKGGGGGGGGGGGAPPHWPTFAASLQKFEKNYYPARSSRRMIEGVATGWHLKPPCHFFLRPSFWVKLTFRTLGCFACRRTYGCASHLISSLSSKGFGNHYRSRSSRLLRSENAEAYLFFEKTALIKDKK